MTLWVTSKTAHTMRLGIIPWARFHLFSDCHAVCDRSPVSVEGRHTELESEGYYNVFVAGRHVGWVCRFCRTRADGLPTEREKRASDWRKVLGCEP